MADDVARRKLLAILASSWLAQALYAVVRLGIADLLADGPRPAGELSAACGADPAALTRVLRALSLHGLLAQPEPGVFALTPASQLLRADVPGSVRLNALLQGEEIFRSFAEIMHTMRTGEPAFAAVYGVPFYDYLGTHPDAADTFHQSMGGQPVPTALSTCDFDGAGVVVDVGGGDGHLLIDVLTRHPDARGVLVETPDAVRLARAEIDRAGLTERVEYVPGSFFEPLPGGGDVYVLARVLHNWADERAVAILRRVRDALPEAGRLVVLEDLLPEAGAGEPAGLTGPGRAAAAMIDLLMLVTLEGRDRTEPEYRALLTAAGFGSIVARRAAGSGLGGALEARRS
jgi:hypothetical protein